MLNMTKTSKDFLQKHLPETLESENLREVFAVFTTLSTKKVLPHRTTTLTTISAAKPKRSMMTFT